MKVVPLPVLTPPISLSLTLVSTCIWVRSAAIKNSVGVWKLAATVCPSCHIAGDHGAVNGRDDIRVFQIDERSL